MRHRLSHPPASAPALLLALLLWCPGPPAGAVSDPPPDSYTLSRWASDKGLPANTVNDILQTPDGYLWLATTAGLVRFDGHRFTVFGSSEGLDTIRIFSLYLTPEGRLWVVTEDGAVLERTASGFESIHEPGPVARLVSHDRHGDVWLIVRDWGTGNLVRISGGVMTRRAEQVDGGLLQDGAGDLWVRLQDGRVARLEGDGFRAYGDPGGALVTDSSTREVLLTRRDGARTLVVTSDGAVRGWYDTDPESVAWLVDRSGTLWVTRGETILAYRLGGDAPIWSGTLAAGARALKLLEDGEGNLWLGSTTGGLYRIKAFPFEILGAEAGIREVLVRRLFARSSDEVVIDALTTHYVVRSGEVTPLDPTTVAHDSPLVSRGSDGSLWQWADGVLVRHTATGPVAVLQVPEPFGLGLVVPDRSDGNVVWLRDRWYVHRVVLGPKRPSLASTHEAIELRDMHQDRRGVVWIAADTGLLRLEGDRVRMLTREDGLPTNRVRAIHEDETGALWFGTYGGGLVRYREGAFQAIGTREGLAEDLVTSILEDRFGNFWMAGNRGIYRAPREDIEAVLDGRAERLQSATYGQQAGLPNPESSGYPGIADDRGRFWFPTFHGVAIVDPAAVRTGVTHTPPLHVESIDSFPDPPDRREATVHVPAGQRRLEFHYTAISLRDPENVHFWYRMEGFDPEWIDAGANRQATYTGLPPGDYTFRVRARVAGSAPGTNETALAVQVDPAFHETRWFSALLVGGVILLGVGAVRLRTRRLRSRGKELEAIVTERTAELARERDTVARQIDRLQELEQDRSRFFANVSHEFRTPLTLIQGPLEDLGEGLHGRLPDRAREQVDLALRNARRMLRLVEQLLGIARAESGRLTLQARRGDLGDFLRRTIRRFQPAAARKGIRLDLETPPEAVPVWFDPDHMEKIVSNLVGNALKFTPQGGRVEVELEVEPEGDGSVVLEVSDDGPGIPADELPRIFDRFHRAGGGTSQAQPGAGIGLALTRELVRLHHGEVGVESRPGQGSRFRVRLPRGRAHLLETEIVTGEEAAFLDRVDELAEEPVGFVDEFPGEEEPPPAGDPQPVGEDVTSVLIVDDHPEVRAYLRRHLERRYRVVQARDGIEALELARRWTPDLIVSDVMMPKMDGIALCEALRADPDLEFVPLILLTAKAGSDSRIAGLEEGADDYLTKPFNIGELEARIDNLIASRRRLKAHFATAVSSIAPKRLRVEPEETVFLERVREAIAAGLEDVDFGAEELARDVGQSRATLYRRLKELVERSPMDLIRSARLEQAARLLREGEGAVGEIAYAVGFRSLAYFSTCFKERYGVTPSAYRRGDAPND